MVRTSLGEVQGRRNEDLAAVDGAGYGGDSGPVGICLGRGWIVCSSEASADHKNYSH